MQYLVNAINEENNGGNARITGSSLIKALEQCKTYLEKYPVVELYEAHEIKDFDNEQYWIVARYTKKEMVSADIALEVNRKLGA